MLSDGIWADDYEVYVGGGICTNITLTANELKCLPPTEEPDPGSNQALFCSDPGGLLVTVSLCVNRRDSPSNNDLLTAHSYRRKLYCVCMAILSFSFAIIFLCVFV